jgi:hypothetical protein
MPQTTIWRVRVACCRTKATHTHLEMVILIGFPLQQWLSECNSVLRYTCNACLVLQDFIILQRSFLSQLYNVRGLALTVTYLID